MNTYYARKGYYKNTKISRIVVVKKFGRDLKSIALPKPDVVWEMLKKMDSEKKAKNNKENNQNIG